MMAETIDLLWRARDREVRVYSGALGFHSESLVSSGTSVELSNSICSRPDRSVTRPTWRYQRKVPAPRDHVWWHPDRRQEHLDTESKLEYAFANFHRGDPGIVPFFAKFLQHQCRATEFEPAPAQLAFVNPLLGHLEAEAFDVESQRLFDIGNAEKRHRLPDVCFGLRRQRSSRDLRTMHFNRHANW